MIKPLLAKLPFAYKIRISQLRLTRSIQDSRIKFAVAQEKETLKHTMKRHQSLLRRKLGSSDPVLQENKITNLGIAIQHLDGLVIAPGETFSFWKQVGKPTKRKGYIEGMLLSQGEVMRGVGGGLCQLANLLFWMALHTPLQISERHHHSFDPFPDENRVMPFGSGASVFYNYVDLRLTNPTNYPIQLKVWLTEQHLKGSIQCEQEWPIAYHIEERNHRFHREQGKKYRENELWRIEIDKRTGLTLKEELIIHNYAEVKYELQSLEKVEQEHSIGI